MRILHVLRSKAWGGLEHYALDLIQKMNVERDHPHTTKQVLLCRRGSRVESEARARGIQIEFSPLALLGANKIIHIHQRQDLPLVRLTRLLAFKQPATPIVYSLYMSAPPKKDIYHQWIYRQVDALISSSQLLNQEVRENFPIDPEKIHLVRYGRNPENSTPSQEAIQNFRKSILHDSNRLAFVTLCRIDPGKGVLDIAHSLEFLNSDELKKIEIWIIGDPTLQTTKSDGTRIFEPESAKTFEFLKLTKSQDAFKDVLKIIPYQKQPELALSAANVFLLATHKETYSLAVLDAFQCERPVLGTHSGGTIEQIGEKQERGWFFEPRNPKDLAEKIREVLANRNSISIKGQLAKSWCRNEHDWAKCLQELNSLYQNLASKETS